MVPAPEALRRAFTNLLVEVVAGGLLSKKELLALVFIDVQTEIHLKSFDIKRRQLFFM